MSSSPIDPLLGAMKSAASGMESQSLRMRLATENLSNSDTPGYKRKLPIFESQNSLVRVERISLDNTPGKTLHDPAHPLSDENGNLEISNVNMLIEMADAREAGRGYDANLQVFAQARRLYGNLLDILKR